MTSSLVGSEMCIRDRSMRGVDWTGRDTGVVARVWEFPGRCGACSFASVSYTHLTLPTICSV
eukprot:5596595-Prorocentrum_lima.AAC.1